MSIIIVRGEPREVRRVLRQLGLRPSYIPLGLSVQEQFLPFGDVREVEVLAFGYPRRRRAGVVLTTVVVVTP